MQTNKINKYPLSAKKCPSHQLNNEGCKCQMCQNIIRTENSKMMKLSYKDKESQKYLKQNTEEAYLRIIQQFAELQKKSSRKLRFALPQICVYDNCNPIYLVTKNKESASIKILRNKSKMNMFEIQNFFLEGFIYHNPKFLNKKKDKYAFGDHSKNECLVLAKYKNNINQMFTLSQIEALFKLKYKHLRQGLMYMQTLVGGKFYEEHRIKIDLKDCQENQPQLYERAKTEALIYSGEIKITDTEYVSEKLQIQFEKSLKAKGIKHYFTYLCLKIVFICSKFNRQIIEQAFFKFVTAKGNQYLWDLRINRYGVHDKYWSSSAEYALQVKLKKTMSMMDFDQKRPVQDKIHLLSPKAEKFCRWLQKSTSEEWGEMNIIRNRLEKLEQQKKSLIESQSQAPLAKTAKSFKLRPLKRKSSFINPQH